MGGEKPEKDKIKWITDHNLKNEAKLFSTIDVSSRILELYMFHVSISSLYSWSVKKENKRKDYGTITPWERTRKNGSSVTTKSSSSCM